MFNRVAKKSDAARDRNLKEPADVTLALDLDYAGTGDLYNRLDVYYPKEAAGPLPVIVNIHGGGYVYGTKEVYRYYGMFLAQQGFTVVNFNYHLAPAYKFPTPLAETCRVLEWMVAHAQDYPMDLSNVFMVGDSAGAQLCSQFAAIATNPAYAALFDFTVPAEVHLRAIALNCGMYTLERRDRNLRGLQRDYYSRRPEKRYPRFEETVDVLGHITENYPPSFVMTASQDFLRPKAEPMYRFLREKGIDAELRCYGAEDDRRMGHVCHVNMNLEEAKDMNREECAFFRKYLV